MTEDSAPLPVKSAGGTDHIHPDHLRKEGWTMALYVAICLIAALTALANVIAIPGHIMGLVWGTTVGLAVAHVFAFRVAGRLVHDGELPKADRIISVVQMAAAAAVAAIVSVPVLLEPTVNEITWLDIPAPPSSVSPAIWSLAVQNAVGSGQYCSASPCWPVLSQSPRSNTRWRVTSPLGQIASPY
jgi:hypothetical protein